jgi:hypothetical protein
MEAFQLATALRMVGPAMDHLNIVTHQPDTYSRVSEDARIFPDGVPLSIYIVNGIPY